MNRLRLWWYRRQLKRRLAQLKREARSLEVLYLSHALELLRELTPPAWRVHRFEGTPDQVAERIAREW